MVEEQVEMEIVFADAHALLPGDEGEAGAKFQAGRFRSHAGWRVSRSRSL